MQIFQEIPFIKQQNETFVMTDGMHDDLTTVWHCADWWNAWWSDHYMALCWLMECMMIWPLYGTVLTDGTHDDLTTIWHCAD